MKKLNEYLVKDINDVSDSVEGYLYEYNVAYGNSDLIDIAWAFRKEDLNEVREMVSGYQYRLGVWKEFVDLLKDYDDAPDQYITIIYIVDEESFYIDSFSEKEILNKPKTSFVKGSWNFEDFIKFAKIKKTILRRK